MIENNTISSNGSGPAPSDDLELVDAKAMLARALVQGSAKLHRKTLMAAIYLVVAWGPEGRRLADLILSYKSQQTMGYTKQITEAIKALANMELQGKLLSKAASNEK